ncbi:hypothetical protein CEK28_04765 [Xenophilus sp. AP218F]|nr:hypothetical protein CEK28_04765 [Xenophilus sp. AP218F]
MSYGKYKLARPAEQPKRAPPPLTPAQRARAAQMRESWLAAFGDDSFIRELHEAGLIDGWRNVLSVTPISEEPTHGDT